MMSLSRLVTTGFIVAYVTTAAWAGVADSPLPVLEEGKGTLHLYSVPGVFVRGILGTYFSCTSTDTGPMTVGVEVFSQSGFLLNDAAATALPVNPGATVMFGTTSAPLGPIGSGDEIYPDASLGLPTAFNQASARILATSKKLTCNVFAATPATYPLAGTMQLTIIAKTKQKAGN